MNERGSKDSSNNRSKCEIMASISSSQKGGLASKDPHNGLKSNTGLETKTKKILNKSKGSTLVSISKKQNICTLNYYIEMKGAEQIIFVLWMEGRKVCAHKINLLSPNHSIVVLQSVDILGNGGVFGWIKLAYPLEPKYESMSGKAEQYCLK